MATESEIYAEAREYLGNLGTKAITNAAMRSILNRLCIKWVRSNDIWFCESSGTITSVVGVREAAAPSLLSRPVSVYYTSAGERVVVQALFKDEFDEKFPVASVGTDNFEYYYYYGDEFWLGPTPNAVVNATVEGYYYPAVLDGTGVTSNVFTVYASGLCLYGLMEEIVRYTYEDDTRLNLFETRASEEMRSIKSEGRRRHSLARRVVCQRKA